MSISTLYPSQLTFFGFLRVVEALGVVVVVRKVVVHVVIVFIRDVFVIRDVVVGILDVSVDANLRISALIGISNCHVTLWQFLG